MKKRSRSKPQALSPLDDLVLTAVKRGAWAVRGVLVYLRIEHEISVFPGQIRSVLAKLKRRGLVSSQKGRWTVAKRVAVGNNGGSIKGAGVIRPRTKEPDLNDPRGQLGAFLRDWIDKHDSGDKSKLAAAAGITPRGVAKWLEGEAAPDLLKLHAIALYMGYSDWSKLAAAAVKFANAQK